MEETIRAEDLDSSLLETHNSVLRKKVLPGEIDGLDTCFYSLVQGHSVENEPRKGSAAVLLFTSGQGLIDCAQCTFGVHEIALFIPDRASPCRISSAGPMLEFLEMVVSFSEADEKEWLAVSGKVPYFLSYSDCKTYRERIKSEKTVSRTLLPEHTFPRLCVGSVETTGPDQVASHKHPMLEQLFFGLKDNDCVVRADDKEKIFTENMLLHVPLGSDHSVRVEKPKKLHYIWIDLFRNREGMNWITQEHIPNQS